jgi:hypothetical protein
VLNRPLNYIDPTGHAQIAPDDGGVGCLAKITCKTDDVWRAYEVSGGNDQEKKQERASKRLEQAYWDHQEGDAALAKDTTVVAEGVSASVDFAAQNSVGGAGVRSAFTRYRQYDVVPYKTDIKDSGLQKHHGILDKWASSNNIAGYSKDQAPAILLTPTQHDLTRSEFAKWRTVKTGSPTGPVDWSKMSVGDAHELSTRMFNAAGVPAEAQARYFAAFQKYLVGN